MKKRAKLVSSIVMGALYVAAGVNHFVNEAFYVAIMPPWIPWHRAMVAISGVAEILLGILVWIPKTRRIGGWGVVALLVAVFPANLHMALAAPGTFDAPAWALWARLPVQALLVAWALWSTWPEPQKSA
ncbi:MAG: DoxX family protein [Myxococcales bacterium]|nr:DoxX family protein [Myxococcales bacterium]